MDFYKSTFLNLMIKINFYHSLIFFNLCIFLSGIEYLREGSFLLISLFLILTIGISHGSLDHIKGKKLIKYFGYKSMGIFYLSYLLIGAVIILIWLIFPKSLPVSYTHLRAHET